MNGIEFIGFNYQHYFSIFDRTNKWIYQNKNCDFLSKTAVISSIRAIQQNGVLFLSTTCEQSSVNCFISLNPIGFYQLFLPHLHWNCTECEMCHKLYWHRAEMKCIEETLNLYSLLGAVYSQHSKWFSSTNEWQQLRLKRMAKWSAKCISCTHRAIYKIE